MIKTSFMTVYDAKFCIELDWGTYRLFCVSKYIIWIIVFTFCVVYMLTNPIISKRTIWVDCKAYQALVSWTKVVEIIMLKWFHIFD